MENRFDPAKDASNIAKHGLSLARAFDFDLDAAAVVRDDRFSYGEVRYLAFGYLDGQAHCLAFTIRDVVIRPISLRRAHKKEMARYGK